MQPLPNRFQRFQLNSVEEEMARQVSPYFFALLQNKIADYADAVIEVSYKGEEDHQLVATNHERLKAQVEVLEELMRELDVPSEENKVQI